MPGGMVVHVSMEKALDEWEEVVRLGLHLSCWRDIDQNNY